MAGPRPVRHDGLMTNNTSVPPRAPQSSNSFFEWMRGLGVTREPGWIGGVSAGLAARLGIDALIVRGIFVVVAILGAPALLLYAAAWALLPDATGRIHLEELFRGTVDRAIAGIGVMVLLALLPFGGSGWWFFPGFDDGWFSGRSLGGVIWAVLLVGSAVWLVVWLARRAPSTPAGPPYSAAPTETAAPSASFAAGTTAEGTSTAGASPEGTSPADAPAAPPAVPAGAADEELAAWKLQQADWKRANDEWRREQQASAREKQQAAAAERRRLGQEAAAERRRAYEERDRLTRPGATYSLVAIGLALIAGAATALAVAPLAWAVESKTVAAMSASLVVLAVAIIINGFRGRRSGGSGGLAVLLVVSLIATSFFGWVRGPVVSSRTITWQPTWSSADHDRTVVAGDVRLDLRDFAEDAPADDTMRMLELTVVAGEVTVIAPADLASRVDVSVTFGSVAPGGAGRESTDGVGVERVFDFEPRATAGGASRRDAPRLIVDITVVAGEVAVGQAR